MDGSHDRERPSVANQALPCGALRRNGHASQHGELNDRLRTMAEPLPADRAPSDLRWQLHKVTDKDRDLPDAKMIVMAAILMSEAFRDVASGFDLGESQFIEAPLYEAKSMTRMGEVEPDPERRDPRRWFLFHILPRKAALMPEASRGVSPNEWPNGSIHWSVNVPGTPDIVLSLAAIGGPDVWHDPALMGTIFFSDRFERAIKAAKLRTPAFVFKPCRVA